MPKPAVAGFVFSRMYCERIVLRGQYGVFRYFMALGLYSCAVIAINLIAVALCKQQAQPYGGDSR